MWIRHSGGTAELAGCFGPFFHTDRFDVPEFSCAIALLSARTSMPVAIHQLLSILVLRELPLEERVSLQDNAGVTHLIVAHVRQNVGELARGPPSGEGQRRLILHREKYNGHVETGSLICPMCSRPTAYRIPRLRVCRDAERTPGLRSARPQRSGEESTHRIVKRSMPAE